MCGVSVLRPTVLLKALENTTHMPGCPWLLAASEFLTCNGITLTLTSAGSYPCVISGLGVSSLLL